MAVTGLTPTNTKTVYTEEEIKSACGSERFEQVRDIGIICKKGDKLLQFFHKTGQEFCCAIYLGCNLDKLDSYLQSIKTFTDAFTVAMVLRFACGSQGAAVRILGKLFDIFASQSNDQLRKHHQYLSISDRLSFDDARHIQEFIELCLDCNFEAQLKDCFAPNMQNIFMDGKVLFHGISPKTAVSLAYVMEFCPKSIQAIILRPIAHVSHPLVIEGPIGNVYYTSLEAIKYLPDEEVQKICDEFLAHASNLDLHPGFRNLSAVSSRVLAALITCAQACEGLPCSSETNIRPVMNSLQHTNLLVLDVNNYALGNNFEHLLEAMKNEQMQFVMQLNVSNTSPNGAQTTRLVQSLHKMPLLTRLDISSNKAEAGKTIPSLAKYLRHGSNLQAIKMDDLRTPAADMRKLTQSLSYLTQLTHLSMRGNDLDDAVALCLISSLTPTLIYLVIGGDKVGFNSLSLETYGHLLKAIYCKCPRLENLYVYGIRYPTYFLKRTGKTLGTIKHMKTLVLQIAKEVSSNPVPDDAMDSFFEGLCQSKSMVSLSLLELTLTKRQFMVLLDLGRQIALQELT